VALSSNYELYADMSRRMMSLIGQYAPEQEIYSIDESFLRFRGFRDWDLTTHGIRLRQQVRQWTGIPVGVGIGPTKTLAKLANRLAKRHPDFKAFGVCNLQDIEPWNQIRYFSEVEVEDLWGISRNWGAKLRQLGIESAQDLKMADPEAMRKRFGVVMERIVREMNGVSCIPLEDATPARQQIIASRSFGHPVTHLNDLLESVAMHVTRAAERLRQDGQVAGAIQIFFGTNPFKPDDPQYHPALLIPFASPTHDTAKLIQAAHIGIRRLYKPGYRYKKAGVMLVDLSSATIRQGELFGQELGIDTPRRDRLLTTLDTVNILMGRGTLRFAAEGAIQPWRMRRDKVTPGYTTRWADLPCVG
jgi:DNA polymerase V